MPASPYPPCPHQRKRVIAEDQDSKYFECLDCGQIVEADEMPIQNNSGYDESLSDA